MSSSRYTLRDLAEEAKKRVVVLLICVFGLSYLMSLTSSSVWINLPFATCLIFLFRYWSLDFDFKRNAAMRTKDRRDALTNQTPIQRGSAVELHMISTKKLEKIDWRKKVNSPPVEVAIEKFTRHIISEWVTDLWYSRITPDKEGPEELVDLVNGVLGEVASRARDVNLINLLTRDIVNLLCKHLELFRLCQSHTGKEQFVNLPPDQRDSALKSALESEKRLHPALFSLASEHEFLQQLTSGLLSITLRPEDLGCSFFRYSAREILACVVLRPIVNLVNPRFINERIEGLVIMLANRAALKRAVEQENLSSPPPMPSSDQLYAAMDKSSPGLELVQVRLDQSKSSPSTQVEKDVPKNNLVSHKSLPSDKKSKNVEPKGSMNVEPKGSEAQWVQALDQMTKQKCEVLEPGHFENVWSKGRDYKKKEYNSISSGGNSNNFIKTPTSVTSTSNVRSSNQGSLASQQDGKFYPIYDESESSDFSEDDDELENAENENENKNESNSVMGLDTPGIRVWESKSKHRGNTTITSSQIHHPLESPEMHKKKRNKKNQSKKLRKRSRPYAPNLRQEAKGGSFLLEDAHDKQNSPLSDLNFGEEYFDYAEAENGLGRAFSGMGASCSLSSYSSSISSYSSSLGYSANNVLADSFIKLKSEVIGANIVKSGSGMFAVYSVAVSDVNGNSWTIKRRFRHFEELHRRLKEFTEYNLSLPPKHFLSSGLEGAVVRERCKLLDTYLKKLLKIPTVSSSIEVWDFLSVDSQTYIFTDSLSIIQTLSVKLEDRTYDRKSPTSKLAEDSNSMGNLFSIAETSSTSKEDTTPVNQMYRQAGGGLRLRKANDTYNNSSSTYRDNAGNVPDSTVQTDFSFSIKSGKSKKSVLPETEHANYSSQIDEDDDDTITPDNWTPPNLTVPVLNLVNVIFQVQGGGWIRRQAFWVAKQLLQLGMGDAFDDWLVDKIQLLRKGPVIASGIQRIEQILWPDGIFLTKHPKRRPPAQASSQSNQSNPSSPILTPEQQVEAAQRAKFVRELMIDKAPTALVSLVGRKEYERGAEDVYMFFQSPVCLKQLAYDLLELLVLATFPELDDVVRQFHQQK